MWLLTAFAASALILAAVGSYGVMAYSVAQRTHEIGIRLALGASPSSVLRMVVVRGAALAAIGILIGSGGALILTSSLASFLPARRAIQVDPAADLRSE
jgi:putative ABC transport system permease protein